MAANVVAGIPSSAYAWQTLGNAVSLISALIAALLYGNIGSSLARIRAIMMIKY